MQRQASTPTGPRSNRQSGRQILARQPHRGGIQKRGSTPLRVDRDGDLDMGGGDVRSARGGKIARSGRGATMKGAALSRRQNTPDAPTSRARARPTRDGMEASAVQRAFLKQTGANEIIPKGSRSKAREGPRESGNGLEKICVRGLKDSKAASNPGGGVSELVTFLERKATHGTEGPMKIKKSRLEGDVLIIFVRLADAPRILKLDSYTFAGSTLRIGGMNTNTAPTDSSTNAETPDTIEVLKSFLSRRYNPETKLLDLSQTGSDAELVHIGMFNTTSTESKFFPALMKVCDSLFATSKEKEEAVASISLANNALSNITAVSSLSQTFPHLKNLDLSNNQIGNLKALEGWRWKFTNLEQLLLLGNPLEANEPNFQVSLMRWYPTLTTLNNVQIRSLEEAAAAKSSKLPLPILGPNFRDEGTIAENFIKRFFQGFDSDRAGVVNAFYDHHSTFSFSVNTSAPRTPDPVSKWDSYIRRSRNLSKITAVSAKRDRLHKGIDTITDCFNALPLTRHPDFAVESQKWCIECNTIPGLPDATGNSLGGVGGLMVMVHGEFTEMESGKTTVNGKRSFDRTFVLGPGGGIGGIRVVCDTLVLRAYGGSQAWIPEASEATLGTTNSTLQTSSPQTPVPAGLGSPGPGKTDEQVQKEKLALDLSKATGMTLEYSAMCLEQSGWNLQEAAKVFEQAKANLPATAFVG